jgi:hypothetical protein
VEASRRVRVRRVWRRRDDDGMLGQVAPDFRELVPQALAALGFEEIFTSPAAIFPSCWEPAKRTAWR